MNRLVRINSEGYVRRYEIREVICSSATFLHALLSSALCFFLKRHHDINFFKNSRLVYIVTPFAALLIAMVVSRISYFYVFCSVTACNLIGLLLWINNAPYYLSSIGISLSFYVFFFLSYHYYTDWMGRRLKLIMFTATMTLLFAAAYLVEILVAIFALFSSDPSISTVTLIIVFIFGSCLSFMLNCCFLKRNTNNDKPKLSFALEIAYILRFTSAIYLCNLVTVALLASVYYQRFFAYFYSEDANFLKGPEWGVFPMIFVLSLFFCHQFKMRIRLEILCKTLALCVIFLIYLELGMFVDCLATCWLLILFYAEFVSGLVFFKKKNPVNDFVSMGLVCCLAVSGAEASEEPLITNIKNQLLGCGILLGLAPLSVSFI